MELTQNLGLYQGKVVSDPIIVPMAGDHKCAFLDLKTLVNELSPNGQWTTSAINIPLMVLDQRKVAVVEKFVEKGKRLLVHTYYKAWKDEQGRDKHAMVVTKMSLGSKEFKNGEEDVVNKLPVQK